MLIHEKPDVQEKEQKMKLPPVAENNDSVMKYLSETRGLDPSVIMTFIEMGDIYEDKNHHNVVFLGRDKKRQVRYAHCRGTSDSFRQDVKGSDKAFGFCWRGRGKDLYVFEAPVDMLSFMEMFPKGWVDNSYLSLGGVASKALDQFLADRPDIQTVYLCLDSDEAGEKACSRIAASISESITVKRIQPRHKDWNDDLRSKDDLEPPIVKTLSVNSKGIEALTMAELYDHSYPPREPVIEGLLYGGTYIFAGAPKVGKSFLMMQLAYHIATGKPLWGFPVTKGEALYLALEDDYSRLQGRLYKMFDIESTQNLHLAIKANSISDGLIKQIEDFLKLHPKTRLVIVDTLQKVRDNEIEGYSYANDYQTISALKEFSDRTGICILVVHHTRKMDSPDSFEMISGTNGLLGAADGAFILQKEKRTSNKATLSIVGRDQEDMTITLKKNQDSLIWEMDSIENETYQAPPDPLLLAINGFMSGRDPWSGTASELLEELPEIDMKANVLVRKLNVLSGELFNNFGIRYVPNQRTSERRTFQLMIDIEKLELITHSDDMTKNDDDLDPTLNDNTSSETPVYK